MKMVLESPPPSAARRSYPDAACGPHPGLAPARAMLALGILALAAVLALAAAPTNAWAFELSTTDGSAAANHGYSWTYSNGKLTIAVPMDSGYEGYEGVAYESTFAKGVEPDTELTIPEAIDGSSVQTIAFDWKPNFGKLTTEQMADMSAENFAKVQEYSRFKHIKRMSLPRGIKQLTYGCKFYFSQENTVEGNKVTWSVGFTNLETLDFYGDGEYILETLNVVKKNNRIFPPSLKKFNPGKVSVEGADYDIDCVIPSSVKNLYAASFAGTAITSAYVPSSVKNFNTYKNVNAFTDCNQLTRLISESSVLGALPQSIVDLKLLGEITELGNSTYSGWQSLENIEVPQSVQTIGKSVFENCINLKAVNFAGESALSSIGSDCFTGCSSLDAITIPDSVSFIGSGAFAKSGLERIKLPAKLWEGMTIANFNKDPAAIDLQTLKGAQLFVSSDVSSLYQGGKLLNTSLKSVDFSSYEQDFVPYYMFMGCSELKEVRIPSSVNAIYEGSFADCANLSKVYLYGATVNIAGAAESNDTGDGSGGVGEGGWTEVYPSAFGKHVGIEAGANAYTVNSDLTLYGVGFEQNDAINYAKAYADKFNCKFIPFGILGDAGKSDEVKALFGYEMPANVVTATDVAVGGTPSFTLAYQDEDIERTLVPGEDCTVAYKDAKGATVQSLSHDGMFTATITGDGDSVWGTTDVKVKVGTGVEPSSPSLVVPGNTPRTDDKTADKASDTTDEPAHETPATTPDKTPAPAPDKAAGSGESADAAKAVAEGVTVEGTMATVAKTEITAADVKAAVDAGATNIVLSSAVKTVAAGAFQGNTAVQSVTLGANVTSIGKRAFSGCTSLSSLVIPAKVKKVGAQVFKGCKSLKTVTFATKKLTKKSVRGALKGSSVKTIKVQVKKLKSTKGLKGKALKAAKKYNKKAKATNKKYVKKYKKIFTKKNAGKKVKVK